MQEGLENDEQRVGAEIVRRALPYSLKLIARNAGNNGSVTVQKVTSAHAGPPDRRSFDTCGRGSETQTMAAAHIHSCPFPTLGHGPLA